MHGNNRLGGNSLLDCVVFGRVAGKACAKYMLGDKMKSSLGKTKAGGGPGVHFYFLFCFVFCSFFFWEGDLHVEGFSGCRRCSNMILQVASLQVGGIRV